MLAGVATRVKGWFAIPGIQGGDRSLKEQLRGVGDLAPHLRGASVLDLGCAEGLISLWCCGQGAAFVDAVEVIPSMAEEARRQCAGQPVNVITGDLRNWDAIAPALRGAYDVVLALSVLHKVNFPDRLLAQAAAKAAGLLVVRLPSRILRHIRSHHQPYDIAALLAAEFDLIDEPPGPRGEWVGYFQRRPVALPVAA